MEYLMSVLNHKIELTNKMMESLQFYVWWTHFLEIDYTVVSTRKLPLVQRERGREKNNKSNHTLNAHRNEL